MEDWSSFSEAQLEAKIIQVNDEWIDANRLFNEYFGPIELDIVARIVTVPIVSVPGYLDAITKYIPVRLWPYFYFSDRGLADEEESQRRDRRLVTTIPALISILQYLQFEFPTHVPEKVPFTPMKLFDFATKFGEYVNSPITLDIEDNLVIITHETKEEFNLLTELTGIEVETAREDDITYYYVNFDQISVPVVSDFPSLIPFMEKIEIMFARLQEIARNPPKEWTQNVSQDKPVGKRLALVTRTFPEDYRAVDSLTEHFVEAERIKCHVRGHASPLEVWERIKSTVQTSDPRELQEIIYQQEKGCQLWNIGLGVFLLNYVKAKRILDVSAGWGDRLIAAFGVGAEYYRGCDPNIDLQPVYQRIADSLQPLSPVQLDWKIFPVPFELEAHKFVNGNFDTVLFSPPYYDKELYGGEQTSTTLYPSLESWYQKFYRSSITLSSQALAVGGTFIATVTVGRMQGEIDKILVGSRKFVYLGSVGHSKPGGVIYDTYIWKRVK